MCITGPTEQDKQVFQDLVDVDNQASGAWGQLMADIGGAPNLDVYRTSQGLSLLDLAAAPFSDTPQPLTHAIATLLSNGFVPTASDGAPRFQWNNNDGYCVETTLIHVGLVNGEYISQYEARKLGTGDQDKQVLLGNCSDRKLAKAMHLRSEEYKGSTIDDFVSWMQGQLGAGNQVSIGIYCNVNFEGCDDSDYDHVVSVKSIDDLVITFVDGGLYGDDTASGSPYVFSYPLSEFVGTRQQADASKNLDPKVPRDLYTLPIPSENVQNYGIAIASEAQVVPVRLLPNINNEPNEVTQYNKTTNPTPPTPEGTPVILTGCITGLTPGATYTIYAYDDLFDVPDGGFNTPDNQAIQAGHYVVFTASVNGIYAFTKSISSSDQFACRCVEGEPPAGSPPPAMLPPITPIEFCD